MKGATCLSLQPALPTPHGHACSHAQLQLPHLLYASCQTVATLFKPAIRAATAQEAVDGWVGYSRPQQLELFTDVLVAVHEGAWQQLEARLQEALQLLPHLAAKA